MLEAGPAEVENMLAHLAQVGNMSTLVVEEEGPLVLGAQFSSSPFVLDIPTRWGNGSSFSHSLCNSCEAAEPVEGQLSRGPEVESLQAAAERVEGSETKGADVQHMWAVTEEKLTVRPEVENELAVRAEM